MVLHESKGSRELDRLLRERGEQQKLAGAMGRKPSVVSRWRIGQQKPETASRMWLQEHVGIPWSWWDEPVPADPPDVKGAA